MRRSWRLLLALAVSAGSLLFGCLAEAPSAWPSPEQPDLVPGPVGAGSNESLYVEKGLASGSAARGPVAQPSPSSPDIHADPDVTLSLQSTSVPSDPLAAAAEVGLNQAWYIQQGYADGGTNPPPIAPAHFPSPTPSAQIQLSNNLNHHVFLPLIARPKMVEARALWITRWDYSSVRDVETLVENAAGAGFNILLFQVRGTADAFYDSRIEPWAARLTGTLGGSPGWDPLQVAVDAAHGRGLQVHAYINTYPVWAGVERPPRDCSPEHLYWTLSTRYWDVDEAYPSGAWRVYDSSHQPMLLNVGYLYATPAIPDVDERLVVVAKDILSRYAVDGVHLDLVRYPGPAYSYDPTTEAALADSGVPRADWQRQRVTQLVSRVYSEAVLPHSGVWLSAAVWPIYKNHWGWTASEGYGDYYQDSQGWMKSGVIDAILPMIYPVDVSATPDAFTTDHFSVLTSDFLANDGARHVLLGISAQYHSFHEIADRIAIARDLGAPGHAIFSARLVTGDYPCAERLPCHDPYWDDFAAGPYASQADVPALSRRD